MPDLILVTRHWRIYRPVRMSLLLWGLRYARHIVSEDLPLEQAEGILRMGIGDGRLLIIIGEKDGSHKDTRTKVLATPNRMLTQYSCLFRSLKRWWSIWYS